MSLSMIQKQLFEAIGAYIEKHYTQAADERLPGSSIDVVRESASYGGDRKHKNQSDSRKPADGMTFENRHHGLSDQRLEVIFQEKNETFSQMLFRLIDEQGLKDSEVYNRANIDRRLFSKIRNDMNYTPGKRTVLSFAIALGLSLDETQELLMKAGLALSNCNKGDLIIAFFIENKNYDINDINLMLFKYGQPILG